MSLKVTEQSTSGSKLCGDLSRRSQKSNSRAVREVSFVDAICPGRSNAKGTSVMWGTLSRLSGS